MITIDSLHIQEFRGIRDLTLILGGKSFVVSGPNGSGKSGVIDAIDFAITGDIRRLGGEGSADLSVAKHAPHVLQRGVPSAAVVEMTVTHAATGNQAILRRAVSTARVYLLTPEHPEIRNAIDQLASHTEMALSRRQIMKYVVAPPTQRAQGIQALLKLERLDRMRQLLLSAQNKLNGKAEAALKTAETAEVRLLSQLETADLSDEVVLAAVNANREVLHLLPVAVIDATTQFTAGLDDESPSGFDKRSGVRSLHQLDLALSDRAELTEAAVVVVGALNAINAEPHYSTLIEQRELVTRGLALAIESSCPLCDLPWPDLESLEGHLREKKLRSDAAAELAARFLVASRVLAERLGALHQKVGAVEAVARELGQDVVAESLLDWQLTLDKVVERVGRPEEAGDILRVLIEQTADSGDGVAVDDTGHQIVEVGNEVIGCPSDWTTTREALNEAIVEVPDPSEENAARLFLHLSQQRWGERSSAIQALDHVRKAVQAAETAFSGFCTASDDALTNLYTAVESDFSAFYRGINPDDEGTFTAALTPAAGKLDLLVDFYGIDRFPPNAYHSEGHQDSMGLCLYLALMRRLMGTDFRLAVLDDVVMSVDSGHRRELCRLLQDEFPDVQFIITTHDEVWARQLVNTGVVAPTGRIRFHGWSVTEGPQHGKAPQEWTHIESLLAVDDVPGAAAKLRRTVEGLLSELAENLRAKVIFKSDGRHELGELLGGVSQVHKKLLDQALKSARSWQDAEGEAEVLRRQEARKDAIVTKSEDDWALNVAVHFNEWADLSKEDLAPIVAAWRQFLELFECTNEVCGSSVHVVGPPGNEEALRCSCGTFNLNLLVHRS